ncbi:MAG: cytochrome c biogenesis CcdA family protein [Actinomycetes bacterium]|jgi:cytochrome c-type biogenesis protein
MFDGVESVGFAVQLMVAVGAGVISFVSPCVLPLVPGYLSMMSGYSASQLDAGEYGRGRMLRVILAFIAGFTVVFAALGAVASSISQLLIRNQKALTVVAGWVVIVFGVLMAAMALTERGPLAVLGRERRVEVRPSRFGAWAPPVMGAAFAFAWTPCIGPVLTVILATASTQETLGRGVALLIAYSIGLGVPFLLAGLGMTRLFGRARPHARKISVVSGVLLAAFGLVMATGNLTLLASWLMRFMTSVPWLKDLATV